MTHTEVQFCPPVGGAGAVAAWVLPALQGGLPFLGHGSHPCQCLIGDRPPWPVTGDWAGSHGLAVLSVSEQEGTENGGNGWCVLAPPRWCVCLLLFLRVLRQWAGLGMKFQTHDPEGLSWAGAGTCLALGFPCLSRDWMISRVHSSSDVSIFRSAQCHPINPRGQVDRRVR